MKMFFLPFQVSEEMEGAVGVKRRVVSVEYSKHCTVLSITVRTLGFYVGQFYLSDVMISCAGDSNLI